MLHAADESIKALGAEDHQAAIIAHNDTKHPHLHVVINRVNPEHGKMLDLGKYQERLSKWALSYEQTRGQIYCEQREANWKRRDLGEVFSADKGAAYHKHNQAKGLGHANDNDTRKIMADQKAKDSALSKAGEAMHTRHSQEWKDLPNGMVRARPRSLAGLRAMPLPRFRKPAPISRSNIAPSGVSTMQSNVLKRRFLKSAKPACLGNWKTLLRPSE